MFEYTAILKISTGEGREHIHICPPNTQKGEFLDVVCKMKAMIVEDIRKEQEKEDEEKKCKENETCGKSDAVKPEEKEEDGEKTDKQE